MTEREIFTEALHRPDPADRAAFLDAACGLDRGLQGRIEALLRENSELGSFLERPAVGSLRHPGAADPSDLPIASYDPTLSAGAVVGPYKLLEVIGEGGMGTVWMAQQTEPVRRVVALKLIKAGMDSKQVVARFEAERQALALMDHANIARVLDAGATASGRPYFVMDLVKGVPITRYCDERRLTPRQRLELFVPVCQAVQHAHLKGVIHRDLKPSNVLVALYDGMPVVKVIDFGVAKAAGQPLTEKTLVTGFGAIVGTPEYMSPEQAEINQLDIDTRSDIYSLGVLLYELLTGSPPFTRKELEKAGLLEMLRVIREQEPSKPSTKLSTAEGLPTLAANRSTEPAKLTRLVRGELDWIVMKALEKDRSRRYETANGFARDVQRYLADEPVMACPPSAIYRFRKFVRRHKHAVSVIAILGVMLLAVALSLAVSAMRVWREQSRTQEANLRLSDNLGLALQALDEIYLKVAEERLPRDPARKQEYSDLLKRTLNFYEQFARQNSTDPQVRKAQAKAHERAGAIRVLLDQLAEAEEDLERAIDLFEALRTELPEDRDVRFGLATAHLNLSMAQFRNGRHADALRNLDASQPLLVQLVAEEPREPGYRRTLAKAWNNRGTLLMLERRMREAHQAYERAAELWDALVRERPLQLDFRVGQGETLVNLGSVLKNTGRLPEAETAYRHALAHYERMVEQDPTGPEWRRQRGVLYSNLGVLLRRMGRSADAEKAAGEAIQIQQRLVAEFGSVQEFQGDLALSHLNRAAALGDQGRIADAEKDNRESLGHLERLVKNFPDVPAYRRDQALNYLALSYVHRSAQRWPQSDEALRQAIAIQEELAAKYPSVPEYQYDLAKCWHELGHQLGERKRPKEAEAAQQKAVALSQDLATGWPEVPEYRSLLARCLAYRARILRSSQRPDEAWEPEQQAIDIGEKLIRESPAVIACRVDLAEALLERARLLRLAKRLDEAEKPSVRALELWEQLVADQPTVARNRIGLGGHLNNRGQLFWDRGDLNRARECFERAVTHQEEARKLDPDSAAALTFLRFHYGNLAEVLVLLGRHADAARAAEQLPRIVPNEEQCLRAAALLLDCVRRAERDATLSAADRATTVQGYSERVRGLLEQAEHHAQTPAKATQVTSGLVYNVACAYALLAGQQRGDAKRKEQYGAQAVQLLRQLKPHRNEAQLLDTLKTDADFDPLRTRDDFKKLLAELEGKLK